MAHSYQAKRIPRPFAGEEEFRADCSIIAYASAFCRKNLSLLCAAPALVFLNGEPSGIPDIPFLRGMYGYIAGYTSDERSLSESNASFEPASGRVRGLQ